ncbi:acyl-CoA dehydrogenase family protein [Chelativorans composti]|uniref:acyl-CoA dehydrogenase family protein n=1 Tax=Chelativorans composti TaxID=768533 RepID=UPI003CD0C34B
MTSALAEVKQTEKPGFDATEAVRQISGILSERAAQSDENDIFVAENYPLLKEAGLVDAGVPEELGGGGLEVAELADMLRRMAHACSSTALALSMHTHQVAVPAWRWRYQNVTAVEPLLKRIASEKIIILSSGGSDWIPGSGRAKKVEGGYQISARKTFTSGALAGDILMTGAGLGRLLLPLSAVSHHRAVQISECRRRGDEMCGPVFLLWLPCSGS